MVEDDPRTRELLRTLLTEAGLTVMLAEDRPGALTVLGTVQPSLITLDLELPGIGGAEVLRQIRRTRQLRAPPVVLISGQATIPTRVRRQAPAIIAKPFEVGDLAAALRRLVGAP